MRVFGKKVDLNPVLKKIKIIWATVEFDEDSKKPSLWFDYEGKLYYLVANVEKLCRYAWKISI